jgi:hypothetical protein
MLNRSELSCLTRLSPPSLSLFSRSWLHASALTLQIPVVLLRGRDLALKNSQAALVPLLVLPRLLPLLPLVLLLDRR